ncbi:DUF302 domain-containing protein (plasmid) [Roseomonas sp. CCTCC AB2023176]|uniref:DUF302 domain-containing protein n=1 Tax=Roseomonas sp. CCTCC AB2023176 TaxID=3342640 RepID=UPI0035DD82CC
MAQPGPERPGGVRRRTVFQRFVTLTALLATMEAHLQPRPSMGGETMQDGLLVVASAHDVAASLDRIAEVAAEAGFRPVVRVDHALSAAEVGMQLRPTVLLLLANPQGGTPLMRCDQRVGIELPLRVLAWEDETGQVKVAIGDPSGLEQRFELGDICGEPLARLRAITGRLLDSVRRP